MKRWIKAGIGTGRKVVWYIGTYPDRERVRIDGFRTGGFSSEEEAQAALDEIYEEEYYRSHYPGLKVLSKITYSVYHE